MNPILVLFHALRLSVPVGVAFGLVAWLPPWPAFALSAAVAVLLSAMGLLLVFRSAVNRVMWHNRVASWLLPWGYRIAKGQPLWIGVVSAVVFTLVSGAVILATTVDVPANPAAPGEPAYPIHLPWLLALAWILQGAALMHVVSMWSTLPSGSSPARTLLMIAVVVVALVISSIVLVLRGHPTAGLWVVGGPVLVVGTLFGCFVLMMLTVGRNIRWN